MERSLVVLRRSKLIAMSTLAVHEIVHFHTHTRHEVAVASELWKLPGDHKGR